MEIDINSFTSFNQDNLPDWNCSTCRRGKVFFDLSNITCFETNKSKRARSENDWDPYQIDEHFTGVLKCSNPKCQENYSITGQISYWNLSDDESPSDLVPHYLPTYIYPILHIFRIPEYTPFEVAEAIVTAFKIFWIDKPTCANSVRKVIELILDDKRIAKTELSPTRKRRSISLHKRLLIFQQKNRQIADQLMAIKWIGNVGSHEFEVDPEDLVAGFELLHYSLEKLYGDHEQRMIQLTKYVNKRKRP